MFIGQTTLFKQFTTSPNRATPRKIAVTNEKGETKFIVLKGGDKKGLGEELREACMNKFRVKKKKAILKFFTMSGESLEDDDALSKEMDEGQLVVVIS